MRLLAIDPAAERAVSDTGYVLLEYTDSTMPRVVEAGVIHGGFEGFVNQTEKLPEADYVVCEKYVTYNKASDPSPLLIEGVVRYLYPMVVLQPSSALSMISEKDLKELGLYSSEGHHRDQNSALRHALYFLRKERHLPTLKALTA